MRKNLKKIISLAILALAITLVAQITVLAAVNEATQNASSSEATSIEIKAQDYTTAVASLTFPAGAPSATVSNPSNDKPDTQVFGGAGTAHPVITLLNNSSGSLIIWYNMVAWSDAVSTEHYVVLAKGAACADDTVINNAVTFGSNQTTGITILHTAGNEKDFYLKIALSSEAGKTGTSDLTILGETP